MKRLYIITILHRIDDHRIYSKEALSLRNMFDITFVAPKNKISDIPFNKIHIKTSEHKLSRVKGLVDIFRIIKRDKPDIVILHDFELIFIVPFLRLFVPSVKIIYDMHEDYPHQVIISPKINRFISYWMGFVFLMMEFFILRFLDYLFVADGYLYKKFYNVVKGRIESLYNFPSRKHVLKTRKEKKDCFVYSGGLTFERGLKEMTELAKRLPDKEFYFIGRTFVKEEEEYINSVVKNVKNIKLLGYLPYEEALRIIEMCRYGLVLLHPNEKFKRNISVKQFDYMSKGVIPFIKKGLVSFVKDGWNGFNVDDIEDIISIIKNIDEVKIENMSENCVNTIKNMCNWEREEMKLIKVMKDIV